eukprot:1028055-Pleurochrysis_carterae.AAC.3
MRKGACDNTTHAPAALSISTAYAQLVPERAATSPLRQALCPFTFNHDLLAAPVTIELLRRTRLEAEDLR